MILSFGKIQLIISWNLLTFVGETSAFLLFLILVCCWSGVYADTEPESPVQSEQPIMVSIHSQTLTIEAHVDIPSDFATSEVDPGIWTEDPVSIPKMQPERVSHQS